MIGKVFCLLGFLSGIFLVLEEQKPIGPEEARAQLGKSIVLKMKVMTAKDRLEKRGEIYLDCEEDFKSPKNFAVVITKLGASELKNAGIQSPADHFRGKTIQAKGKVKEVDQVPRIEIDQNSQIEIIGK